MVGGDAIMSTRLRPPRDQGRANTDVIDRVNDVLERLYKLDDALSTLHGFRSLLEDLNSLSPIPLPRGQLHVVATVRAAILRSAIALAVATLERTDSRGNLASLGQILKLLQDEPVADFLSKPHPLRDAKPIWQKVTDALMLYAKVIKGDIFDRVQRLRHDQIGHLLVRDEPVPTVEYADVFALIDEIETLMTLIYDGMGIGPPRFTHEKTKTAEEASRFWRTYLAGISGDA
jgi:hypothetical protein